MGVHMELIAFLHSLEEQHEQQAFVYITEMVAEESERLQQTTDYRWEGNKGGV